jgi:hypothetical protein
MQYRMTRRTGGIVLTIAQQRHSLTVTENRIIRAELSISTVRDMIQTSLTGALTHYRCKTFSLWQSRHSRTFPK